MELLQYGLLLVLVPGLLLHVSETGHDVLAVFRVLKRMAWPELTEKEYRQWIREEEALFDMRMKVLQKFNKLMIHISFLVCCVLALGVVQKPSMITCIRFMGPCLAYAIDVLYHRGVVEIKSRWQWRILEAVGLGVHTTFTFTMAQTADETLEIMVAEKLCSVIYFFIQSILIDARMCVPLYLFHAVVMFRRQLQIIELEHWSPVLIYCSLLSHVFMLVTMIFLDHIFRSMVRVDLASKKASSLLCSVRHVLKGLCDGDLVLDRDQSIVDGAARLQRLLKTQRKLQDTNFLDLFLDEECREKFLRFVANEQDGNTMPRGLRVRLQGAKGPVSLDLFQTTIPDLMGDDHRLLALKEDPDQKVPDAPPGCVPSMPLLQEPIRGMLPSRTRSSCSELVESMDELQEITLLVNGTGPWDVEEAHLRFKRLHDASASEPSMPTLRRLIRPSDWDRLEGMLEFVQQLEPSPDAPARPSCYFRKPMLIRLPGESRSYLCSHESSVCLAESELVPGRAPRFWLHLEGFDSSHVQRPREAELDRIAEDTPEEQEDDLWTDSQPGSELA